MKVNVTILAYTTNLVFRTSPKPLIPRCASIGISPLASLTGTVQVV